MTDNLTQWLVELTAVWYPETQEVVIVEAKDETEATRRAFDTRNIPTNWFVTQVERA